MSALPSPAISHSVGRAREIASDLLIATTVIWALPLLLAAAAAIVRMLL